MQQRRPRPGDVLDDYCPRERRIADHAVVAMIGDDIKQVRCTSCNVEHEYKQGRIPPRRKKDAGAALFGQVLDGLQPSPRPTPLMPSDDVSANTDTPPQSPAAADPGASHERMAGTAEEVASGVDSSGHPIEGEDGPVHRPLIRAQLPRQEGQPPPARALPDFTIRQGRQERSGSGRPPAPQRLDGGRRGGRDGQSHAGAPRRNDRRQDAGGSGPRGDGQSGWSGNRTDRGPRASAGRGAKKR